MAEYALAMLVDFENMARPGAKSRGDFDIALVLDRLNEKGRVIVKRAYADWSRYREAKHQLQNAGLELIEMPSAREGAKNRADIKLAVDAMELAYSREHVDNFVIVSGDSDFTPLVGKLRELNKRVIGVGNRDSTSELLIANCDEFIFYDSIAGARATAQRTTGDVFALLRDTLAALQREGVDWSLASVVKDSMRRKNPAFDEGDSGYSTFSKLLDDAAARGIVRVETDPRSGTYRVELAESGASSPGAAGEERGETESGRRRRGRRRRGAESPGADGAPGTARIPEGAEVFEVVVEATPDEGLGELPPVGEPISYEDMILMGPEVEAEIPELIEQSDLARVEAEQPSRGARRRRRRFSDEAEPSGAEDLATLREDEPAEPARGVLHLEPMGADAVREALEAGGAVRFTVEGVEHADEESLGVATIEDGVVVRAWTSADGKVERRPSKSLEAGVRFLATGRKGAFRAVAATIAHAEVEAPAEAARDAAAIEPAAASEEPGGRRRRRRRPTTPHAEEAAAAPVADDAEAPGRAGGEASDEPSAGGPGRRRRRRTSTPTGGV